jgi:quinol monooxygenase YgiN
MLCGVFGAARRKVFMIIVRISLNVLPEKQLEFTQTLLSMIGPMENEAGCLSFVVACDIENKNCFNLLEEWETREDLDLHIRSHRFGVLLGSKTLLYDPLKIQIFTVSASEGMEAVHSVRKKRT